MIDYTNYFNTEIIRLQAHSGFTSGGQLPKVWDNQHTILYKGEENLGTTFCVYSEVICSDLAELLGIPHVKYWLELHKYTIGDDSKIQYAPLVLCESFTNKDSIAVTLYDVLLNNNCSQSQTVEFIRDKNINLHCMMLLFDFIIANPDRHLRNLGFIKQGNIIKVIPLYDHDKALYSTRVNHTGEPFSRIDIYENERLYQSCMLNLIKVAKTLLPRENLMTLCPWEALYACEDIVNQYTDVPLERRQSIITMIKLRTQFMLEELKHD